MPDDEIDHRDSVGEYPMTVRYERPDGSEVPASAVPKRMMPRKHFPEIVPYPMYEEWLVRCHGCGARIWCQSQEEAESVYAAHRRGRDADIMPQRMHLVVGVNDKGTERQAWRMRSAADAAEFIDRHSDHAHWWGWSFAYLSGFRSEKWLLKQLGSPAAARLLANTPSLPAAGE